MNLQCVSANPMATTDAPHVGHAAFVNATAKFCSRFKRLGITEMWK